MFLGYGRTICAPKLNYREMNTCYSPAGKSVQGKNVPEVRLKARGHRQRVVLKAEGTVFPCKGRLKPVNNVFIFSVFFF